MDAGLAGEASVRAYQPTNQAYNGQPHGFAPRASPRHGGYVNLAMADGHVESFRGEALVNEAVQAYFPQTNVVWTPDPALDPNK